MIIVNINKAKAIAHDVRRAKRTQEFTPLDVEATIPSEAVAAEAARQAVRVKYTDMQMAIDAAQSPEEIKGAMTTS